MSGFGELVRGFRHARSLTQDELAARAGVTVNAVGALERGERLRPYPSTVRALADALDLDDSERHALVAAVPSGARPPSPAEPAGTTGPPGPAPLFSLPSPGVTMFGRDDDLAAVIAMLRSPGRRIVSLTGPGGVGKTTLALAAAAAVRDDFAAAVYVELADVTDPARVIAAIATATGVPEVGDGTARELAPALSGRRLLLVLDNVEHVLDCAGQIAALSAACPDLAVLLTGRASLRVRPEREFRVRPLAHEAAVDLFHDRLAAAGAGVPPGGPAAEAVDVLCARSDGLPLALELAATLAARLGPAALLDRFDGADRPAPRDLPPRQRSIAATFAWSYELLDEPARLLLTRMSVFVAGFHPAAARLVTAHHSAVPGADADVPAALARLVDHALVLPVPDPVGGTRFRMLEPLRAEAVARLSAEALTAARAALAHCALETARGLFVEVQGPRQTRSLDAFESGLGNVSVALTHLAEHDLVDDAVELLWSIRIHLGLRGHTRFGTGWARRLHPRPMSDRSRARLGTVRAVLLTYRKEPARALAIAEDAAGLADRAGDRAAARTASVVGAVDAALTGDPSRARRLVERAEQEDTAGDDDWWAAFHLDVARCLIHLLDHDVREAGRRLLIAEGAARDRGGDYDVALVLLCRSVVDHRRGDPEAVVAHLGEAVGRAVRAATPVLLTTLIPGLARAALEVGAVECGVRLFGAASVYNAEYDLPKPVHGHAALPVHPELSRARDLIGETAFASSWSAGRSSSLADVAALAATVGSGDGSRGRDG